MSSLMQGSGDELISSGTENGRVDGNRQAIDRATTVKVICLGDSAVGKSKLLERYMSDKYKPEVQVSTFALTLYKYQTTIKAETVTVEFWDTAGQERFSSLHPSYYHQADACIMVFDATRKVTYKNLVHWYKELREYRPEIPCFLAANKIDANMEVTKKSFAFSERNNIPMYYVSAAAGSNVVKLFTDAVEAALEYKRNPSHWTDQIMVELEKTPNSETLSFDPSKEEDEESKSNGKDEESSSTQSK